MKIIRKIAIKIRNVFKWIFKIILKLPFFKIKDNKIIFDNFNGRGFGCNPKYIALEIISQNLDFDLVWLVIDLNEEMPKDIRKVKYGSLKSLYELATAKVWIDNVRTYKGVDKKKEQFYIQTWHGSLGPKKIEREIENYLPKKYIKSAKNDGKITDLMLSNSSISTYCYRNNFWYNGPILEIGVPRNDIIINPPSFLKSKILNYYNINIDKHIIIYVPTFRKNLNLDVYRFNYSECLKVFEKVFGMKFVILVRLHPNISNSCDFIDYNDDIINATNYPDCQELLAVADICISDYSSAAFDFAMVNKPVFLLCKDFEEYKKQERELRFDFCKLPFSFATNENELIANIKNFKYDEYIEKCKKFYGKYNLNNNSNSSQEVVRIIREKINDKK